MPTSGKATKGIRPRSEVVHLLADRRVVVGAVDAARLDDHARQARPRSGRLATWWASYFVSS